jgi:L-alanine-DL-glutamate epimerase-like enolase superfamily enzyme
MAYEETLSRINTNSRPSDLRIIDMKVCDIIFHGSNGSSATIFKLITNQDLEGYGQIREGGHRYLLMLLKQFLLGENPCNVDRLFRRLKQYGGNGNLGGAVCGIEIALWDLAGKAYGVPVWQMMGGRFRDKIRVYCDTDVEGKTDGTVMGQVMMDRIKKHGYTMMKMDLSVPEICFDIPGTVTAPLGFREEYMKSTEAMHEYFKYKDLSKLSHEERGKYHADYRKLNDIYNIPGPRTNLHLTEKGLDYMEKYVEDVRSVTGYEVPIATDHFGHIGTQDFIKLAERIDKYNLAWYEDVVPWFMTDELAKISRNCRTPICTGEDIYLKEGFLPLFEKQAVSMIHPDLLTAGGIKETQRIADIAQDYGIGMVVHMNETPIAAMAVAQMAAATENFTAMEFHYNDVEWWKDILISPNPVIKDGFVFVGDEPGLGIGGLNDEVLKEHLHPDYDKQVWYDTDEWNHWYYWDYEWL